VIFTADWHLRKNPPRSRTDDYWSVQERKLRFILKLAQESPPLLVAGDFFDQPRPGPFLECWTIKLLKEYNIRPIVVPGQHDMPGHSLDQLPDSGLGVLAAAGVIHIVEEFSQPVIIPTGTEIIWGCAYGQNPHPSMNDNQRFNILLWHYMVIDSPLWPGQIADHASTILKKFQQFDLIVTGDNHQTFTVQPDKPGDKGRFISGGTGRCLVNPGSMMRMTAAQVNHCPCVFKWESGELEQVFLPIEKDVLDLTDLERTQEKNGRISAFIESLDNQYEIGLSYNKNLEEHMRVNETNPKVQEIVWRSLENDK